MIIQQLAGGQRPPLSAVRLGVVVAMPDEAQTLLGRRPPVGAIVPLGIRGGELAVSGIGLPAATLAARGLIERGATALLSWGTAGGLDPNLGAGALLLPRAVINDVGGQYAMDELWHARVASHLAALGSIETGGLLSRGAPLVGAASKASAFTDTLASAVDMESFALVQVAAEHGIPVLVVRVVVDASGDTLPSAVLRAMSADGRIHFARLGRGLMRRPSELPALLRLARDFRIARRQLTRVAKLLGERDFFAPECHVPVHRSAA